MARIAAIARPLGRALLIALLAAPSLSGVSARWPSAVSLALPSQTLSSPATVIVGPVTPDPRSTAVDSLTISFSEPIDATTFTTGTLQLTRTTVAGTVELPVATIATIRRISDSSYVVENLRVLTTPNGLYQLSVLATQITDLSGAPLSGLESDSWTMDALGPIIINVGPVTPNQRSVPVEALDVYFSEPIKDATFTSANLRLARDDLPLDTGGILITRLSDLVYRLGGLAELTRARGSYALTVDPTAIEDQLGNTSGPEFARAARWEMATAPTIVALAAPSPALRNTPVESLDVTLSEPVDLSSFTAQDLTLTLDGQPLNLSSVTVSQVGVASYRIAPLSMLTAASGPYRLTVDLGGVIDLDDAVSGIGSASVSWVLDTIRPKAVASVVDISTAGVVSQLINVVYTDDRDLDLFSLGVGDLLVSGPNGFAQPATLVGVVAQQGGSWLTTYRISAPGGLWDAADNGSYTVAIKPNEVLDQAGNSVAAAVLESFTVAVTARGQTPRQYLTTIWVPASR